VRLTCVVEVNSFMTKEGVPAGADGMVCWLHPFLFRFGSVLILAPLGRQLRQQGGRQLLESLRFLRMSGGTHGGFRS